MVSNARRNRNQVYFCVALNGLESYCELGFTEKYRKLRTRFGKERKLMDSVSQKGSTFVQVTGDKRRVKHMYVYKISILIQYLWHLTADQVCIQSIQTVTGIGIIAGL